MILDSDSAAYGGHDRLRPDQNHFTRPDPSPTAPRHYLTLYLPTRTAVVLSAYSEATGTGGFLPTP